MNNTTTDMIKFDFCFAASLLTKNAELIKLFAKYVKDFNKMDSLIYSNYISDELITFLVDMGLDVSYNFYESLTKNAKLMESFIFSHFMEENEAIYLLSKMYDLNFQCDETNINKEKLLMWCVKFNSHNYFEIFKSSIDPTLQELQNVDEQGSLYKVVPSIA